MSAKRTVTNEVPPAHRAAASQAVNPRSDIAEALEVIKLSLVSTDVARERFPDYRLTRLVGARLDLDDFDMGHLSEIVDADLLRPLEGVPRPFDHHLRSVIEHFDLKALFRDHRRALYHHAIRPTGYDFHLDEVIPAGMQQWRADYRGMSDTRQMMAASIIWLYRAGKDNIWLRRVPCTWHAADAIDHLSAAGALMDWARLYALYHGW